MQQAGTLMHELGHNLNLLHGGDEDVNRKPNYISVMNYSFQTRGIPPTDPDGAGPLTARLDFSIEDLPDLNENNLSEPAGVGNGSDFTRYVCPSGGTATGPANGAVNWNCDSDSLDTGLAVDINGDGILGILTGFNDWAHLRFNLQSTGDFEDGEHDFSKGSIELDFVTASPPIADAGAVPDGNPTTPPGPPFEAYSCNPGETLQLDGAGSFDLNGAITSYEWDFPGGGSVDATGITPSFTCPSIVGPLTVTLTVTDSDGIKATDEATIKVGPESCYDITINGVTLVGTEGNDLLIGTPRNDLLIGLGGNDALDGRGGDDILFGGEGDDQLFGNYGHDCLEGGPGFDVQAGGYGNDTFVINAGDAPTEPRATEFLQGGPGFDRVVFGTGIRPADCLGIICTDPVTGGTFTLVSIESQLDLATARLLPLNLHVIQLSANPVRRFPLAFWVAGAGVTSLRVELFSLAGLRVWQGKSRTGRLDFHGADSNGRPLANGVYLYLATITDARGKLLRPEVRKLIIKR
jgi:PKD repeat protein